MIEKKQKVKLKSWGMSLNKPDIFDIRAQQRDSDKFSNSIPEISEPSQIQIEEKVVDPNKDIFDIHADKNEKKKDDKFSFLQTAQDIGEQIVTKGISGIGGAYGNILDAFGLQQKEGQTRPGQETINNIQSQILDKIEKGGVPTYGELMLLSDDEGAPNLTRLPSSKNIQEGIQGLTGIGEGKTPVGRIAGQGSQFLGEGVATGGGGKALLALGGSGVAGQGIREAGGPEGLATAIEIGGPLLHGAITSRLAPTSKAAKDTVNAGRKIGLTESQITPLTKQEGTVTNVLSKLSRKGTRKKKLFNSIKESLGDSYNTIKSSPQAKVKLPNPEQISLRKEFGNIRNELSKTLAPSPDKEAAINYIEKSLETLRNTDVTPEYLVNFWQDINKSVKWNSITGGKKALAQLKEPISKTLKKISPDLAENFELTNNLYSKYAQISKKLKPDLVDSFVNKGELISVIPSGIALATGNPTPLLGLGGEIATRLLAREMLINPYFQNLANKLVTNLNSGSVKGTTELVKQAQDYMKRKHPKEDWSFLTDIPED